LKVLFIDFINTFQNYHVRVKAKYPPRFGPIECSLELNNGPSGREPDILALPTWQNGLSSSGFTDCNPMELSHLMRLALRQLETISVSNCASLLTYLRWPMFCLSVDVLILQTEHVVI